MKKIFFIVFFLYSAMTDLIAQDSLRIILCTESGVDCSGLPSLDKTIEHIDSLGNITEINYYHFERCDEEYPDSNFLHQYDYLYLYDSLQQLISETLNTYGGDTVYHLQVVNYYSYDSLGNKITDLRLVAFPLPVLYLTFDSLSFDTSGNKIFSIHKEWNNGIQELDTIRIQTWAYDTLNRISNIDFFNHDGFVFQGMSHTFYFYDSLSNLTSQVYSNSINSGSTRILNYYDSLNLKIASWSQRLDTVLFTWENYSHSVFIYDSLSSLIFKYNFYCWDSLCSDSSDKTVYEYDAAGHLVEETYYDYDNPGWLFTGNSYTSYDAWNYVLTDGWWSVDFEGCDESDHFIYTYNSDHQLVHSHERDWGCGYLDTDCDYYHLNQDSILIVMHSPAFSCAFDTIYLPVTAQGGVPPYSYHWSPIDNLLDTNVVSPLIVTDSTVIYTLTVTDSLGLSASVSDTIFVYPKNIHPVAVTSTGITCDGNYTYLLFDSDSLVHPYYSTWYRNGFYFSGSIDTLPVLLDGNYSVNLIDGTYGCQLMSEPFSVQFLPLPAPNIFSFGNTFLCSGQNVSLTSDSFPHVLWNTGDSSLMINTSTAGGYFVTVIDTNGCTNSSNVINVVVNPLPVVSLGNDTTLCIPQSITLDAGTGLLNYQWQDGSGSQTFLANSAIADSIVFSVTVIDFNSCSNSDSVQIVFDFCSVTGIIDENDFTVYPNPATSQLTVSIPKGNSFDRISFEILDLAGRRVVSTQLIGIEEQIDLSLLAKGVYQFKFTVKNDELKSGKFVIE